MDITSPAGFQLPEVFSVRRVNVPYLLDADGNVLPVMLSPTEGDEITDADLLTKLESLGYHQNSDGGFELARKPLSAVRCEPSLN